MKTKILAAATLVAVCSSVNAAGFSPSFYVGLHADYNKLSFDESALNAAVQQAFANLLAELEAYRKIVVEFRIDNVIANDVGLNSRADFDAIAGAYSHIDSTVQKTLKYSNQGSTSLKKKRVSLTPTLGIQLHENFAVELSYTQMQKLHSAALHHDLNAKITLGAITPGNGLDATLEAVDLPDFPGTNKHEYEFKISDIYHVDIKGSLPINQRIALIGTVGLGHYKIKLSETSKITFNAINAGTSYKKRVKHTLAPRVGLGIAYRISDAFSIEAMARYQHINAKMDFAEQHDVKVLKSNTSIGLGIVYAF
ncbi:MAG: hypothetical protein COB50_01370 [Thiotrichales bacterium]|nr:MAG: hypothetical protein COB50_01370 [Thiotrichales bacterium]